MSALPSAPPLSLPDQKKWFLIALSFFILMTFIRWIPYWDSVGCDYFGQMLTVFHLYLLYLMLYLLFIVSSLSLSFLLVK